MAQQSSIEANASVDITVIGYPVIDFVLFVPVFFLVLPNRTRRYCSSVLVKAFFFLALSELV